MIEVLFAVGTPPWFHRTAIERDEHKPALSGIMGEALDQVMPLRKNPHPARAAHTATGTGITLAFAGGIALLTGCITPGGTEPAEEEYQARATYPVFDPATVIQDGWRHVPVRAGETEYRIAHLDGRLAVRARGRQSASGLLRRVSVDPQRCPILEWSWRVEVLQQKADLHTKEGDDVAACLFLLFGDPGFLSSPVAVPTLRYVWSNGRAKKEAVIDNPYFPGVVRSIVVQADSENLGKWVTEKRNVVTDYERAFGEKPKDVVHVVAIFTDNDQTKEPVEAYYGDARFLCPQGKTVER